MLPVIGRIIARSIGLHAIGRGPVYPVNEKSIRSPTEIGETEIVIFLGSSDPSRTVASAEVPGLDGPDAHQELLISPRPRVILDDDGPIVSKVGPETARSSSRDSNAYPTDFRPRLLHVVKKFS